MNKATEVLLSDILSGHNARKTGLRILDRFLKLSSGAFAYGCLLDVLFPEWNKGKNQKYERNVINIVVDNTDYSAADDICRDLVYVYSGDSAITISSCDTVCDYNFPPGRYNNYEDKSSRNIHTNEDDIHCLHFKVSFDSRGADSRAADSRAADSRTGSNQIIFRIILSRNHVVPIKYYYAHNYIALRNNANGLPELFMLDENITSKTRNRTCVLEVMDLIKSYRAGLYHFSDHANNVCASVSRGAQYSWTEPNRKQLADAKVAYENGTTSRNENYKSLKEKYMEYDRVMFFRSFVRSVSDVVNKGICIPDGYNCRMVTLGELRKTGVLKPMIPKSAESMDDVNWDFDEYKIRKERELNIRMDALSLDRDIFSCALCSGALERLKEPFQLMDDCEFVYIIGAAIYHEFCVNNAYKHPCHASIKLDESFDCITADEMDRYYSAPGCKSLGINTDCRSYLDSRSQKSEEMSCKAIYNKYVFSNVILKESHTKIFGGFVRRYLGAEIGSEFREIFASEADVDVMTVENTNEKFMNLISIAGDSVVSLNTQRHRSMSQDNSNGIMLDFRVTSIVGQQCSAERSDASVLTVDIHTESDFQEPHRYDYTVDAFPNMLSLDIVAGSLSLFSIKSRMDLRRETISYLETFLIAIASSVERVYVLNQTIPSKIDKLSPNDLRRTYKPLEMMVNGWEINFAYVKWNNKKKYNLGCISQGYMRGITDLTRAKTEKEIPHHSIVDMSVFVLSMPNADEQMTSESACMFCNCSLITMGDLKKASTSKKYLFEMILGVSLKLKCGHRACLRCLHFGKMLQKIIKKEDYYDCDFELCTQIINDAIRGKSRKYGRYEETEDLCAEFHEPCISKDCYHMNSCGSAKQIRLRLA